MPAIFQAMKSKIVLYVKINIINLVIGSICSAIALWLLFFPYGLQGGYVNLLLQFFVPVLLAVPVVEKAKPFFSEEIGEIIGGAWQILFHNILSVEIPCVLYIGFLAMETKYMTDNTGDIFTILLFQTLLFQGLALIAFILSGTTYTGCTMPFLLQMLSVFMVVELPGFSSFTLIAETDHNMRAYFMQRWYYVIVLVVEWWIIYLLYKNRFRFCKWL